MKRSILFLIMSILVSFSVKAQWQLTGNAGTNPSVHFVGTTDNVPLKFRMNNIPMGYLAEYQLFLGNNAGNSSTGNYNTGVGWWALKSNTTGYLNTAFGGASLYNNTTGQSNTATGYNALGSNTSGNYNAGFGLQALWGNTTGNYNTAAGTWTLNNITTGYSNTAIGFAAGYYNAYRHNNVAVGDSALWGGFGTTPSTIEGSYNTAVGSHSLSNNTTGYLNTAVGYRSLANNTTGSYNTAVGYNAYPVNGTVTNYTGIGYGVGSSSSVSNSVEIGNSSVTWIGGQVGWSTYSDKRIKENIKEDVKGLDFILKLRPVTYNLNVHRQNQMTRSANIAEKEENWNGKYNIEAKRLTGFVAQEVEEAAKQSDYDFNGVTKPETPDGLYSLRYSDFVVPLVKAVQEQQQMIEKLEQKIKELEKKVAACSTNL
jgi:hypothetical protein